MKPTLSIIHHENNPYGRRRIESNMVDSRPFDRRGSAPYGVWERFDDGMVDRRKNERRK